MTVKPIIFSGPMVRALLEGRKSQTRRILKPQPEPWKDFHLEGGCQRSDWTFAPDWYTDNGKDYRYALVMHCPFHESRVQVLPYAPGDLLYVRENWAARLDEDHIRPNDLRRRVVFFWADGPGRCFNTGCAGAAGKVRPSIHMPRRYSRLTLEVVSVKVERLQDISADDCRAEGHPPGPAHYPQEVHDDAARDWFMDLWDEINAKRAPWASNPWVVAVTFTVIHRNVDELLAEREAA